MHSLFFFIYHLFEISMPSVHFPGVQVFFVHYSQYERVTEQ